MDKIKSFKEFTLNEKGSALGFLGGILTGNIDIFDKPDQWSGIGWSSTQF